MFCGQSVCYSKVSPISHNLAREANSFSFKSWEDFLCKIRKFRGVVKERQCHSTETCLGESLDFVSYLIRCSDDRTGTVSSGKAIAEHGQHLGCK